MEKLKEGVVLAVGSHTATIVKYLSEGGFSHIYKVKIEPKEDDSDIACLKRVIVQDKHGLTQLRKEVDVMKTLSKGKHIVQYYDSHAERLDNGTYQVLVLMELCPNGSLLDYMNSKIKTMLTESEILKIMYDISLGIYEMHILNLIHRDIKIENVLIDAKHVFKLCDFGSTAAPAAPPKDQRQFQLLSHDILYQTTPQYRAPEMIDLYRGFPIDEKADIWALGCFLYKLCYYTTPFEKNGDIAILHASFQFPQAPQFSGDLKNLMIIMLQESPVFRPNIVQVIILLTKMLNLDFKDTRTKDFYNAGPYNFHALHEYQRQKQAELLKQQQYYYQQQQSQQQSQQHLQAQAQSTVTPKVPASSRPASQAGANLAGHASSLSIGDQALDQTLSPDANSSRSNRHSLYSNDSVKQSSVHDRQVSIKSQKSSEGYRSRVQSVERTVPDIQPNEEDYAHSNNSEELSFSDFDQLENAEQRFPSLDDLVVDTEPTGPEVSEHIDQTAYPVVSATIPVKSYSSVSNHVDMNELNQQSPQIRQGFYSQNTLSKVNSRKTQHEGTEYEKKETWEKSQSRIDTEARKLADDIFAKPQKAQIPSNVDGSLGTSHVSSLALPITAVKTNQSGTSDLSSSRTDISREDLPLSLQKSNVSFEEDEPQTERISDDLDLYLDIDGTDNVKASEDLFRSKSLSEVPPNNVFPIVKSDYKAAPLGLATSLPLMSNGELISSQKSEMPLPVVAPVVIPVKKEVPQTSASVKLAQSIPLQKHVQAHAPLPNALPKVSHASANNNNPFPLKPKNLSEDLNSKLDLKPLNTEERKSANPWGEYRASGGSNQNQSTTHPVNTSYNRAAEVSTKIHEQLASMNLTDEPTFRKSSRDEGLVEPNLIDLEVGLESSSSSSATPILMPKIHVVKRGHDIGSQTSLLDLSVDDGYDIGASELGSTNPPKKRIASIQIPANISFQEEVIDFASDDENPENSSKMSRLSIRNSLKKPKSRKSGEYKRTDSNASDGKKRLSFFGGSSG